MKKPWKIVLICFLAAIGCILVYVIQMLVGSLLLKLSLDHSWYANSPNEQPLSCWADENDRIELHVQNPCGTVGSIRTDDGPVEVVLDIFVQDGEITVYPIESLGEDGEIDRSLYPPLEKWDSYFRWHDDRFEVTVIESTYFTPGETFTIYRTNEGHPYLKRWKAGY